MLLGEKKIDGWLRRRARGDIWLADETASREDECCVCVFFFPPFTRGTSLQIHP